MKRVLADVLDPVYIKQIQAHLSASVPRSSFPTCTGSMSDGRSAARHPELSPEMERCKAIPKLPGWRN